MKLSEAIHFDQTSMKFNGFTDLGKYTPNQHVNVRGDHALVLMYQPFKGKWVQALGAFLSKSCASSDVLHKLLLECTILLENSGFCVDGITTDGAQWNRMMWTEFGVNYKKNSCPHPCDENRRLWLYSDFSHLLKNLRNIIVSLKEIWVILWWKNFENFLKLNRLVYVLFMDNFSRHLME